MELGKRILFYTSQVLLCLFVGMSHAAVETTSIAGIWTFDEGHGEIARDSSPNQNHGTFTNPAGIAWVTGKFGNALEFKGTDYIAVPSSPSLEMNDTLCIALWVKVNTVGRYPGFVYKGQVGTGAYWGIHERPDSQVVYARIDTNGGDNQNGGNIDNVSDGEWHHIVFAFDKGAIVLFLDGNELPDQVYNHGKGFSNTEEMGIGSGFYPQDPRELDAVVDDLGIFNVVLAADDVQRIMQDGLKETFGLAAVDRAGKLSVLWALLRSR